MVDDFDDISCEDFYQDDLMEMGNREAFEDAQAEMMDMDEELPDRDDDREIEVDYDTDDCDFDEDFGDHPWDNER